MEASRWASNTSIGIMDGETGQHSPGAGPVQLASGVSPRQQQPAVMQMQDVLSQGRQPTHSWQCDPGRSIAQVTELPQRLHL